MEKSFNRFCDYIISFFDLQKNTYNLILVIIKPVKKIIYFNLVEITIYVFRLAKVIINVVVQHHHLVYLMIIDYGLVFILKF